MNKLAFSLLSLSLVCSLASARGSAGGHWRRSFDDLDDFYARELYGDLAERSKFSAAANVVHHLHGHGHGHHPNGHHIHLHAPDTSSNDASSNPDRREYDGLEERSKFSAAANVVHHLHGHGHGHHPNGHHIHIHTPDTSSSDANSNPDRREYISGPYGLEERSKFSAAANVVHHMHGHGHHPNGHHIHVHVPDSSSNDASGNPDRREYIASPYDLAERSKFGAAGAVVHHHPHGNHHPGHHIHLHVSSETSSNDGNTNPDRREYMDSPLEARSYLSWMDFDDLD